MSGHDDLVQAWLRWDSKPGDRATAMGLDAEVRNLAEALGVSTLRIRQRMAAGRRKGYSREEIVAVLAEKRPDA